MVWRLRASRCGRGACREAPLLFTRTRRGCVLTAAGESLVEDARSIARQPADALRRARGRSDADGHTVRLGVSLLSPAAKTLDAWPRIHERAPQLKLELTPIGDIYDDRAGIVRNLGEEVDLIQAAYRTQLPLSRRSSRRIASCLMFRGLGGNGSLAGLSTPSGSVILARATFGRSGIWCCTFRNHHAVPIGVFARRARSLRVSYTSLRL